MSMRFVCSSCGSIAPADTRKAACECGGLWDLAFDPPPFDLALVDRSIWGMFRYRAFLPLLDDSWRRVSLGEGMTPIIKLEEDLFVKLDYAMPTLSFKDRGAAVLMTHCRSIGVDSVVQDSSGNAGNSVAAYAGRMGIACEIYVPEGTSPRKIAMIESHGAHVRVIPGTRDQCAEACRKAVSGGGRYYASHVYNPLFFQGTKTYIYEVFEQLGRVPATLFIPLGNGTLYLGAVCALDELEAAGLIRERPHIVAVQSERCDPLATAVERGESAPALVSTTPTMAEGIAIGAPARGRAILAAIARRGDSVLRAPESGILEARALLASRGLYVEHTTAATYAAYLAMRKHRQCPRDYLIPLCGAGLKSDK